MSRRECAAATVSPRERFEKSKSPEDFLRWLNAYTNEGRRGDEELHALCSWAHSVIAALQNELATREPNQAVMNLRAERVARENGEPEKASDKQRALIADLCRRKNVSQPDLAGLTKPKASELIDSLNDGSYDPAQWTVPF